MTARASFPSEGAMARAAQKLGCSPAAVWAVAEVEAGPHGAFLDSGEPVILFERHRFHALTRGRFAGRRAEDAPFPWAVVSAPRPGGYGPVSVQHRRLAAAARLDREAALKSASWGLFQIMGENHARAGHATLQGFVNAAYRSVDAHLAMFVAFVLADTRLVAALRTRNWLNFARIYNGPAHARNRYAERMAQGFALHDALKF